MTLHTSNFPERLTKLPTPFSKTPERFSNSLWRFSKPPEHFSNSPMPFDNSPEPFFKRPGASVKSRERLLKVTAHGQAAGHAFREFLIEIVVVEGVEEGDDGLDVAEFEAEFLRHQRVEHRGRDVRVGDLVPA